eukprot:1160179-Pelagomonas_calceolata.AAC.13
MLVLLHPQPHIPPHTNLADGCLRVPCGCCREPQHGMRPQHSAQDVAQAEVGGAERMAPLAHAVSLIHTHLVYVHARTYLYICTCLCANAHASIKGKAAMQAYTQQQNRSRSARDDKHLGHQREQTPKARAHQGYALQFAQGAQHAGVQKLLRCHIEQLHVMGVKESVCVKSVLSSEARVDRSWQKKEHLPLAMHDLSKKV